MKPVRIHARLLRDWPLPALDENLGKVGRGRVVVVGGSTEVPGAAVLAAIATLRAGAGTVQIATARSAAIHVAIAVPEARVVGLPVGRSGDLAGTGAAAVLRLVADCDALLLGPGMRATGAGRRILAGLARREHDGAVVVDAGALQELPRSEMQAKLVLTPHAGEAAEMLSIDSREVRRAPLEVAVRLAETFHAVVVLKGARTVIVDSDGARFDNIAGNIGLGTSGSGDTLSGVIAGLCARGASPLQAAVWGVHVHAKAGERLARKVAPVGYLARELLAEIPALIAAWSR